MFRLGPFELDTRHQQMLKDGLRVELARKPYAILVYLIENRDRLVTREELLERFWDGQDVYDQTMTRAIARIRSALGEARGKTQFIETRWAAGYQYVGPFEEIAEAEIPPPAEPSLPQRDHEQTFKPEVLEAPLAEQVRPNRHLILRAAMLALLSLAMLSGGILWQFRGAGFHPPLLAAGDTHPAAAWLRKTVAVMPFQNLSGGSQDHWLETAIPEMVATDLSADARVRTIPAHEINRAVTELQLAGASDISRPKLQALHQDLNADLIVAGSFVVLDSGAGSKKQIRIDLKVLDATSGETVLSCSDSGRLDELFAIATSAGSRITASLILPGKPGDALKLEAAAPADPAAMREYMEGLASVRSEDLIAAQGHFEKSIAIEPSFALSHLALSDAWGMRGYQEKRQSQAKVAESLSGPLDREQRLLLQGRYASSTGAWDKAIESYRALYTFFPDNIEYGLALADAQTSSGKPAEAQETIRTLRELPAPFRDDPRIDIAAAHAAQSTSQSREAAEYAQRAMDKARQRGAMLQYAHALSVKSGNMAAIDINQSIRESDEARGICAQFNDLACEASILRRMGIFQVNSNPAAAESALRKALFLARKIGNIAEQDNDLNGLAAILSNRGNYAAADLMYRDLLDDAHQLNDGWGIQMALNNLGNDLFEEGRIADARRMQEEALAISRRIGLKSAEGDELLSLSQIHLAQADPQDAKRAAEEALSIFTTLRDEENRAVALSALGEAERVAGDLEKARKDQRAAVDVLVKLGAVAVLAESRLSLARSALDSGDVDEVTTLAQSAATEFARQRRPDEEGCARAILSLALARRGKMDDAGQQMRRALALIGGGQSEIPRDEVQIDATLLQARSLRSSSLLETERASEAISVLTQRAARLHLDLIAMDARLAQAELKLRSSSAEENQARLERIATDAQRAGDIHVARRAQQLLGQLNVRNGLARNDAPLAIE